MFRCKVDGRVRAREWKVHARPGWRAAERFGGVTALGHVGVLGFRVW